MNFLKENGLGSTTYQMIEERRKQTMERWENIGFLEGLEGHIKENIATLYETQAEVMLKESSTSQNSGSFETIAFPMIRRVYSKLLANEIVSVQALNMPIGKLFFFLPKISERAEDGSQPSLADQLPTCVGSEECNLAEYEVKSLYDMFYNDGLFDRTKGKKTLVTAPATAVDMKQTIASNAIVPAQALAVDNDGAVRYATLAVEGFEGFQGKLDYKGAKGQYREMGIQMDTESFLASLTIITKKDIKSKDGLVTIAKKDEKLNFRLVAQRYGHGIVQKNGRSTAEDSLCDDKGVIYIELDLTAPADIKSAETNDGYVGADFAIADVKDIVVTFASYDSLEMSSEMAEVTFELSEISVSVEPRKLRATWSPELATDVKAFQNLNAEAELTAILSEQVAAEIDREILKDLRNGASVLNRWDWLGWKKSSMASNAYTQKDWNQTLMTSINQLDAQINKATLRGGANYIVISPEVSAILNDLEYFHVSDASAESLEYNLGISKMGTIQGRFTVYVDAYAPHNSIIVGRKGKSLLDTGYVYAPYVPLELTPTLQNYHNFANVKGISTRYAKKMVNNRFFAKVVLDNVRTFDTTELY